MKAFVSRASSEVHGSGRRSDVGFAWLAKMTMIAALSLAFLCWGRLPAEAYEGWPTTLSAGQYLFPGQYLVAPPDTYDGTVKFLAMQADGNLVLYYKSCSRFVSGTCYAYLPPVAYWSTNTYGRGGYVVMQYDGNFVMRSWNGSVVWWTGTYGNPGAYVVMQTNGNLAVVGSNGRLLALYPQQLIK